MEPMRRRPDSHKGENGKVAVIGGSAPQHGAPLFSALAAEAGGADLLFVRVPACHALVARTASLNFQVTPFAGDEFARADLRSTLELLATVDCAVVGPGIARDAATLDALRELVRSAPCPLVLDASALQPWTLQAAKGRGCVVTPHLGELERMGIDPSAIAGAAAEYGVTVLAKGPVDRVTVGDGTVIDIEGGDPGLTVGGTGDALAGLAASLLAQGMTAPDACVLASRTIKRAGVILRETRETYATRDVISLIPVVLRHD